MLLDFDMKIEINNDNPFKNDALERKDLIEILTTFIEHTDKEMVLAIDSEWGTGKTTFVNMWEKHLVNIGYETLYFNAWESDFVDEPFIAFVNEFETILKQHPKFDKFIQVSKNVVKGIAPGVIKLVTAGALDIDRVQIGVEAEKTIIDYSEKVADDQIKNYKNTKNAMKEFRKLLIEFIDKKVSESGKPIVFFIDELDRCRPNFSIQLLEKIKHLFNIKGLIFILSIDKKELGNSIRAIYGCDMNVNGYLARFFDVEYTLPEPKLELYVDFMFRRLKIENYYSKRTYDSDVELSKTILRELIRVFGFTLRIQEKLFFRLILVLRTTDNNQPLYEPLMTFLLCLKSADIDLYHEIFKQNISFEDFKIKIQKYGLLCKYFTDLDRYGALLEGVLLWTFNSINDINNMKNKLEQYGKDWTNLTREEESEKNHLDYVINVYNKYSRCWSSPKTILEYLSKKIELCDSFKLNND